MREQQQPRFGRIHPTSATNLDAALALAAVLAILVVLWMWVFALAALFDPYLNARPVWRPPLTSPSHWIDAPNAIPAVLR